MTISVPKLQPSTTTIPTTHPAKVALFAPLFRGREDVYPRFWTNENKGTKGWAPACSNEWKRPLCQKPKVKCGECPHQAFGSVTPQVIQDHLQGHHVVGVYPLMRSERCHLLAIDFDKSSWAHDVGAFAETCRAIGLPAAVERSRSGNGAHAWLEMLRLPLVIGRSNVARSTEKHRRSPVVANEPLHGRAAAGTRAMISRTTSRATAMAWWTSSSAGSSGIPG